VDVVAASIQFISYMGDLNQATFGTRSKPQEISTETVRAIASNKATQDLQNQTDDTMAHNNEKNAQMNGTADINIFHRTGIDAINQIDWERKGSNVDIMV